MSRQEQMAVAVRRVGSQAEVARYYGVSRQCVNQAVKTEARPARRPYNISGVPDYADVGCEYATAYLGHQSRCLDCPLPECVEVLADNGRLGDGKYMYIPSPIKMARNQEIRIARASGKKIYEIAGEFGLSYRTVQRALQVEAVREMDDGVLCNG